MGGFALAWVPLGEPSDEVDSRTEAAVIEPISNDARGR